MEQLEQEIKKREELVNKLEREFQSTKRTLDQVKRELSFLLGTRLILQNNSNPPINNNGESLMLPEIDPEVEVSYSLPYPVPSTPSTLVEEVVAVLSSAERPLGPKEIQQVLAREGRVVQHNVLTGILSRLVSNKDGRIIRLERGKYICGIPNPGGIIREDAQKPSDCSR